MLVCWLSGARSFLRRDLRQYRIVPCLMLATTAYMTPRHGKDVRYSNNHMLVERAIHYLSQVSGGLKCLRTNATSAATELVSTEPHCLSWSAGCLPVESKTQYGARMFQQTCPCQTPVTTVCRSRVSNSPASQTVRQPAWSGARSDGHQVTNDRLWRSRSGHHSGCSIPKSLPKVRTLPPRAGCAWALLAFAFPPPWTLRWPPCPMPAPLPQPVVAVAAPFSPAHTLGTALQLHCSVHLHPTLVKPAILCLLVAHCSKIVFGIAEPASLCRATSRPCGLVKLLEDAPGCWTRFASSHQHLNGLKL